MCIAVAPPRRVVTPPRGYRIPPDGAPALAGRQPRGPTRHSPLDEGPPAGGLWPVTNAGVMGWRQPVLTSSTPGCDGFGLSLALEWCSRSVELAAIERMSVEVAARREEFKLRIKTWARRQ